MFTISKDDRNDGSNNGTTASELVHMRGVWIRPGKIMSISMNHGESFFVVVVVVEF